MPLQEKPVYFFYDKSFFENKYSEMFAQSASILERESRLKV